MNCLLCGAEIQYDKNRKRERKYCSKACELEYKKAQAMIPKSYCLKCGKPLYTLTKHGNLRKFCSDECKQEQRHEERFKYVICDYCGKTFEEKRDSPNIYCSRKCSGKASAARKVLIDDRGEKYSNEDHKKELLEEYEKLVEQAKHIQYRIKHEKVCIECGKPFISKNVTYKCCSEECSKKHQNRNKDKRIYRNGKPDLSITLTKLYMRDGGVCQICGRAIDFDCDCNSDYYPSIDHIMPISKGGLHRWDNVQLACRGCNTAKRDKI